MTVKRRSSDRLSDGRQTVGQGSGGTVFDHGRDRRHDRHGPVWMTAEGTVENDHRTLTHFVLQWFPHGSFRVAAGTTIGLADGRTVREGQAR
jgi:hypothetical protein